MHKAKQPTVETVFDPPGWWAYNACGGAGPKSGAGACTSWQLQSSRAKVACVTAKQAAYGDKQYMLDTAVQN